MAANEYQVGGDHYKSAYEHWDWVLNCGLGYLEGVTTKYVTRWRKKKDGGNDLRKALHYIDKLIEECDPHALEEVLDRLAAVDLHPGAERELWVAETRKFAQANALTELEMDFCVILATWDTKDELLRARAILFALIDTLPAPLEDSNKHGERTNGGI